MSCLILAACSSEEAAAPGAGDASVAATAAAHEGDTPEPTPLAAGEPEAPVIAQDLAYGATETSNLIGYLAMPEEVIEPLPGIIVIHEWWGLNDNIRAMTRKLAAEGYVALAIDLYGGAKAETPEQAQTLMAATMAEPDAALANIRQAHGYLTDYALAPKVATLGWCLGGAWSLRAGLGLGQEIDAVVMYYGQIELDAEALEMLEAPLLGLFAELDESIPARDVQKFRSTLWEIGKTAEVMIYSDVAHAFANPSGGTYHAKSANDAWSRTLEFLDRHL
jgi:carboxymethylenebutenolidase